LSVTRGSWSQKSPVSNPLPSLWWLWDLQEGTQGLNGISGISQSFKRTKQVQFQTREPSSFRILEPEKPSFKASALSGTALGSAGGGARPHWGLRDLRIDHKKSNGAEHQCENP
jgi:hypothetical protein